MNREHRPNPPDPSSRGSSAGSSGYGSSTSCGRPQIASTTRILRRRKRLERRSPVAHSQTGDGNEELILVLRGTPTLRTPDGQRQLQPGDFAHFPNGPDGAHQVVNRTDEPARYVVADAKVSPEIIGYPDSGKIASMSRETQLWSIHRLGDAVDYFDGEQPQR
jgi:hypothetical protein